MEDALTRLQTALVSAATASTSIESPNTIGADVVSVDRIRKIRSARAEQFDSLAFTPAEIAYCMSKQDPDVHFAGHLAAKEAVYKALGIAWTMAFSWRFIEVRHADDGSPFVSFAGPERTWIAGDESSRVSVSIAHTNDYAIAVAFVSPT